MANTKFITLKCPNCSMPLKVEMTKEANDSYIQYTNVATIGHWLETWLPNMAKNGRWVDANHSISSYIEVVLDARNGKQIDSILVLSSGPSADSLLTPEGVSFLKSFTGLIITSPTNAHIPLIAGRVPDICVVGDANRVVSEQIYQLPEVIKRKTDFFLPPFVDPTITSIVNRCYFYKSFIASDEGNLENTFNTYQDLMFPALPSKDHLIQAATTPNSAVQLAYLLRQREAVKRNVKIYLSGFDFSYPNLKPRCSGFIEVGGRFEPLSRGFKFDPTTSPVTPVMELVNPYTGEKIWTDDVQLRGKHSLLILWASFWSQKEEPNGKEKEELTWRDEAPFYTLEPEGVLWELPSVTFTGVSSNRVVDYNRELVKDRMKRYHEETYPISFPHLFNKEKT